MTSGRRGGAVLLVLLLAHVAFGVARLPGKVWARRCAEVESYREQGAARHLLDSARLDGADVIEWLCANVPPDAAVQWRLPADGALEFVAALIAPRLLVDERQVPAGVASYAGRLLARGTIPGGATGAIVVQGTERGGLELRVRGD